VIRRSSRDPPPWAVPLPTGCWVHFQHSLSASSQWQWICLFVLFLCLVCFCMPKCASSVGAASLCFLNKYKCLVFLPFLCSASPHLSSPVQCSSVPWYPLGCYPGYLAVPLVCFGSHLAVPTQGGGSQRRQSPACWRHCFARFQAVIARVVAL